MTTHLMTPMTVLPLRARLYGAGRSDIQQTDQRLAYTRRIVSEFELQELDPRVNIQVGCKHSRDSVAANDKNAWRLLDRPTRQSTRPHDDAEPGERYPTAPTT